MRRVKIFSGSSHPLLAESICEWLGTQPAKCDLKKFSNGETSVSIGTSIRDQDVFIVQSGSSKINDNVMELLIMISACKGGSAKSITGHGDAVRIPNVCESGPKLSEERYFPYSRQSKKKSHRGAITARMLANLLSVAGIQHVITVDLHASQMQGFFGKPVDNLHAEPLIARWIRNHVPGWTEAVVVSKNPGGTKRVTSLADALKLNFGIVTTDRRRPNMTGSTILDSAMLREGLGTDGVCDMDHTTTAELEVEVQTDPVGNDDGVRPHPKPSQRLRVQTNSSPQPTSHPQRQPNGYPGSSPLIQSTRVESTSPPTSRTRPDEGIGSASAPGAVDTPEEDSADEYTDERAREVITGRLIQGHIVDDDYPSPILSAMSGSVATLPGERMSSTHMDEADPMASSFMSTVSSFQPDGALGGSIDAAASSDEEEEGYKNPEL
ncbi:MAG: hypothetical protein M1830_002382, partial [Pleopsidium flavum]